MLVDSIMHDKIIFSRHVEVARVEGLCGDSCACVVLTLDRNDASLMIDHKLPGKWSSRMSRSEP